MLATLYALLTAFAGALLCVRLNTPLPWMIGPLFACAALRLGGAGLHAPVPLREAGQWAIGTALGLYFTAPVVQALASWWPYLLASVSFSILLGAASAWLLRRWSGTDPGTAFFAMAAGGASEMAVQGERHGASAERVAAAHSLRIMLVVALIPLALRWWSEHGMAGGHDLYVPGAAQVRPAGLLLLVLLSSGAALLLKRRRLPNAWVLGPLAVTLLLTAGGVSLSSLPEPAIRLGQLFIGMSLGCRFAPGFLRAAPRYMASVAACNLLAMTLAAGFGLALARLAGLHPATAVLATSPGGIAEMALTAKTLHLGVPVVTAFHVARMVVLVLAIGPAFRLLQRWRPRA